LEIIHLLLNNFTRISKIPNPLHFNLPSQQPPLCNLADRLARHKDELQTRH